MNAYLYRNALILFVVTASTSTTRAVTYTVTLLNPPQFAGSEGRGISGTSQVGYGGGDVTGGSIHAVLWNSTATSLVDLHPAGFDVSFALDASGSSQVGYGSQPLKGYHALLWNGTATSFVDLDPGTYALGTYALGVSGTTQVGYGATGAAGPLPRTRALLWHGTSSSVVDLTPPLFSDAIAYDTSDTSQVGSRP